VGTHGNMSLASTRNIAIDDVFCTYMQWPIAKGNVAN
jgi:hypothetical protein